ncbi:MAG: KpsF/GutQ family sugar-phosphate isomerase [Desulfobacterales bacterium]|nr:KpsF/GutQ family sugar-phosphate isomerase [Desulfobacterales bacterium]
MIIGKAVDVLKIEAEGVLALTSRVDDNFVELVELICDSTGRLIISGIGKSGDVGRKIVATLNSTGTRSLFLHPVEALHGDLGMVGRGDIFIGVSNSGETDELNILLPTIRGIGCKMIAFTGNPRSTLAKNSDIVIDVGVEREACSLGLAPTASTTALLAMGDALAVVLIDQKHFNSDDFRKFHPGGALGRRLAGKVRDIMFTGKAVPSTPEGASMKDAVKKLDRRGLGAILVLAPDGSLTGIITDGDIRRCITRERPVLDLIVDDVMTRNPLSVHPGTPAYDALNIMERRQITVLPIVDESGKAVGILHLHDILGKGKFEFNGSHV